MTVTWFCKYKLFCCIIVLNCKIASFICDKLTEVGDFDVAMHYF